MQVHITISSEGGATGAATTSVSPSPDAGGQGGSLHVMATPDAGASGGVGAISAGAAPSALAFHAADTSGIGGAQDGADQSAGPAPHF